MQMTGLSPTRDSIVEIACVVTEGDRQLTRVGDPVHVIIHLTDTELQHMSDWCVKQFAKVGALVLYAMM
jgi:oligoribonuclease (3'-5' exoribonuclease)